MEYAVRYVSLLSTWVPRTLLFSFSNAFSTVAFLNRWSLGCILAELYRGELLFATHDNIEHSALIERTIGPFPRGMVKASKNNKSMDLARVAFDSFGRHLMERVLPRANAVFVQRTQTLESVIRSEDAWFLDLLRMILVIDPHERATAHECLQYLSRIRRDVVRF